MEFKRLIKQMLNLCGNKLLDETIMTSAVCHCTPATHNLTLTTT